MNLHNKGKAKHWQQPEEGVSKTTFLGQSEKVSLKHMAHL